MNRQTTITAFPLPAAQARSDDEIDFRELLGTLWRGRWLAAIVFASVLALGGAYYFLDTPIYPANALLQVETQDKSIQDALGDQLAQMFGQSASTDAEIAIIKSRLVLGKVFEDLNLDIEIHPYRFPVFGAFVARKHRPQDALAEPLLGMRYFGWGGEKLDIGRLDLPIELMETELQLIRRDAGYELRDSHGNRLLSGVPGTLASARTEDGEVAIFVRSLSANPGTRFAVTKWGLGDAIDNFLEVFDAEETAKDSGVIGITYEDPDRARAVDIVNRIADRYQLQNIEHRSAEAAKTLEFLDLQLPKLKTRVENAEALLTQFRLREGSVDLNSETQLALQQAVTLDGGKLQLEQQRDQLLQQFRPNHPSVQAVLAQLAEVARSNTALDRKIGRLPEKQQQLLRLMRDVDVDTQLYTSLLNNAQELEVARGGTVGNVRVIDHAVPAIEPEWPNPAVVGGLSVALGLLLGFGTVLVRRALNRAVDDPAAIERRFGLSTFASIPFSAAQGRLERRIRRGELGAQSLAQIEPDNVAVEAIRSLRTSLHFALIDAPNNIVVVTGPTPGLGKSFVALNLAMVLAGAGQRVLVIDADLRRGHLHRVLGQAQQPGLSEHLAGAASVDEITRGQFVDHLDFIPAGTLPPNPAELLLNRRFAALLETLSARYDHVLIDTPPVLPVTDAAVIGQLAGCVLLVLKAGEHSMEAIEDSLRKLNQGGAVTRGVLFNQVGRDRSRPAYGYYGAYRSDPTRQPA